MQTKSISYGKLLQESFSEWKQVWLKFLVVQILGNSAALLAFGVLLCIEIAMLILLGYDLFGYGSNWKDATVQQLITSLISALQTSGIILVIVFMIINFIILMGIGAFVRSVLISWFHDSVEGKKIGFHQVGAYGKKFWNVLWKVDLLRGATVGIPVFVVMWVVKNLVQKSGWGFMSIALVIIIVCYVVFAALAWVVVLFFMHPLLADIKKVPALKALLQSSWEFIKKNKSVFVVTLCLVIAVSMVVSMILFIIGTIISVPFVVLNATLMLVVVKIFGQIISMLVHRVLAVYTGLFVFNVYHAKK